MIIKDYTEEDFPQILEIERGYFNTNSSLKNIKAFYGKNYKNLKVEINSKIIGFIQSIYSIDALDVINIAIVDEYRKQGVGYTLLCEIEKFCSKNNIYQIFLEVRKSNQAAINLYLKKGFKEISKRNNYYKNQDGSYEDALVFCFYL
ncbi:MAG: ribosomal protein S18-alanine N-acetyltransferase [Psittacicella sp.]